MYSFQPLADTSGIHVMWFSVVLAVALVAGIMMWVRIRDSVRKDPNLAGDVWVGCCGTVILVVVVALVGIDCNNAPPKNEQVTATFVAFKPGVHIDIRYSYPVHYVVYSVNGQNVILVGQEGFAYPPVVTLYKN